MLDPEVKFSRSTKTNLVLPSASFDQLAAAITSQNEANLLAAQQAQSAKDAADAAAAAHKADVSAQAKKDAEDKAIKAANANSNDSWSVFAEGFSAASYFDSDTTAGKLARKSVNGLSDVVTILEVTIAIIKTVSVIISAFQSDVNNLMIALNFAIKAIISALEELAVSIASTGIYGLLVTPDISPTSSGTQPGGFKEFKAKVNNALTNKSDPNRPVFFEGDIMGGVVVALVGTTNVGDLMNDLSVLARFFKDESDKGRLSPVGSLTATPGLFYETENSGFFGTISGYLTTGAALGVKNPGIKLSWSAPKGLPIDGYRIYRSKTMKGEYPEKDVKTPKTNMVNPGMPLREYKDFAFNGGKPVTLDGSDDKMSFTDFEVLGGETYYYKVSPLLKNKKGDYVEDPTIGGFTHATATSCVPTDWLDSKYETPDGLMQGVATGDPPFWNNISLRGLLGESFDAILKGLNDIAKRFEAVTESSSKHFEKLIKTLEKWLKNLKEFLEKLKAVLESLKALQFSSAAMILTIPSEKGGVEGFKRRFNSATVGKAYSGFSALKGEKEKYDLEKQANPFEDTLCSVCAGMVILVGAPTPESVKKLGGVAKGELDKIKAAGNFDKAKAAMKAARSKDFSNGKASSADDDSGQFLDQTISFLTGLFSG